MKILRGTVFGGIAFFLLGWLVYGILLMDYSSANYDQSIYRADGEMIWWALIASNLAIALLLTLVLKWSGAKAITDGLKTGAILGFLLSLNINLSFYSMTTMFLHFSGLVVDVLVFTLMMAVIGLIIVSLWGKKSKDTE
ncbi:hypothetical protein D1164_13770 [Mariniphaga sediminis]|jgi:hypothetical protein|uniref:DUF1761 domain-containing protein n=1 Tax=Mariniphaga sediminis TaxID=1628158 RepID=A0A399D2T3_9BACT|nr:hypothetical protein [Mariniphaga sediminis]RIH64700.1 hypothetical protein D1164_13770 [Mariniphaga sediminis]